MKKIRKIIITVTAIFLFSVSVTGCYLMPKEETILEPPLIKEQKVTYDVVKVVKANIEKSIKGRAIFVPMRTEKCYFKFRGGYIKDIKVNLGDMVNEGDTLIELDNDSIKSEIEIQKLALEKQQELYKQNTAQNQINLKMKELEYNKQLEELNKMKKLKGKYSNEEIKNKEQVVQMKQLEIQGYKLECDKNKMLSELEIKMIKKKIDDLQLQHTKSTLKAPMSGKVIYMAKEDIGEYVGANSTLVKIANDSTKLLQYSSSRDAGEFKVGMKVEVNYKNKKYIGEVVMSPWEIAKDSDLTLDKSVRIRIDDIQDVKLGANADIKLILDEKKNVLILPKNLIRNYKGRKYVQVLKDGIKIEKDIETGIETPTEVEIVKGLLEGDEVIVR